MSKKLPSAIKQAHISTKGDLTVGVYGESATLSANGANLIELDVLAEEERGPVLEEFRARLGDAFGGLWGERAMVVFDFEAAGADDMTLPRAKDEMVAALAQGSAELLVFAWHYFDNREIDDSLKAAPFIVHAKPDGSMPTPVADWPAAEPLVRLADVEALLAQPSSAQSMMLAASSRTVALQGLTKD